MPYPTTSLYPQTSGLYPGDGVEVLPEVVTGSASNIDTDSASVAGTVDPNGLETHYYFEYGLTTAYGEQTSESNAGNGTSSVAVSATLSGLAGGRTYHYRLVAFNGVGFAYGADAGFDTTVADLSEFLSSTIAEPGRGQ